MILRLLEWVLQWPFYTRSAVITGCRLWTGLLWTRNVELWFIWWLTTRLLILESWHIIRSLLVQVMLPPTGWSCTIWLINSSGSSVLFPLTLVIGSLLHLRSSNWTRRLRLSMVFLKNQRAHACLQTSRIWLEWSKAFRNSRVRLCSLLLDFSVISLMFLHEYASKQGENTEWHSRI